MKILIAVKGNVFGAAMAQFIGLSNWKESSEGRVVNVMEPSHGLCRVKNHKRF